MTKAITPKPMFWLPLLFLAFYSSFQINKLDTKHAHAHASVGIVGDGGFSASISGDKTDSATRSTTYTNAKLNAKHINLHSKKDTNIAGANVHASKVLDVRVDGSLNVQSLQNKQSEDEQSRGANLSTDGSGGINSSTYKQRTTQTVLTTLTGKKATIHVADNTNIKGALVASATVDKEGNLQDNHTLDLTTKTLTTSHLANREYTKDKSFGLDASSSTTSLNRKNDTTYTKTKTLATLGQGTVNITGKDAASKDALKQTNRDITKVDKDIYHVERTQGTIDATLDNRLLTEDGHKSIAEDIKRNEFLVESVADVVTKDAFEVGDTLDHIDEVQKDLTVQKQMALLDDGKYIQALSDGTPEQKQAALNQYAKIYADTYGISIEKARVIATNKYIKGATHNQKGNNNIYINDNAQKNATDYAHTMGHEVTHARINQGVARDRGSHRLNEQYADTMGNYSADGMEFSNNTYTNNPKINQHTTTNHHRGNRNSQLLKTNTQGFVDVVKRDGGNVDYSLSHDQLKDLQKRAAQGDEGAQRELDEFEASVNAQKGVTDDVIVPLAKEALEIIPTTGAAIALYEGIKNGDIVGTVVTDVALKKLRLAEKLAKAGNKIVKAGGRYYAKIKGKVVDVTHSAKQYNVNTMRPAHIGSGKGEYQFGTNKNQETHAWRHLENESGLSRDEVTPEIEKLIKTEGHNIKDPKAYNYVIQVNGKKIQVTLSRHPNGKINIGRMHEIR